MKSTEFTLTPNNHKHLANLCGNFNEHLNLIEHHLAVEIIQRDHFFKILGPRTSIDHAAHLIQQLYEQISNGETLNSNSLSTTLQGIQTKHQPQKIHDEVTIHIQKNKVRPKTVNQARYVSRIQKHDVSFGIGPAGTGKTYLAVACAVEALEQGSVKRIILIRPAVEAGEHLGFLPGDLSQKVDPYLRPMYDALYDFMGAERVTQLIEKQIIEIAPLAFMRGRTLNDAFIILDEAQNTTKEQMKMFLTRLGFNSKAVVTGDITQVDLPKNVIPGLRDAIEILANIDEISMTFFETTDAVRHELIQRILEAYDNH